MQKKCRNWRRVNRNELGMCQGRRESEAINTALKPRAMDQMVSQTHVELSDLGQDIVMLGAASLVLSSELGVVYILLPQHFA